MAEHLNWGILATGMIAKAFGRGLKASRTGTLVAVGSRTLESAEAFTNEHGGTPYAAYHDVLDDPRVEAVYIATPHHLHEEWTIKAARAGKAILCEKPFTLNLIEAKRALEEVRKANVFFMEAFMYRCHPQILKLRELIRDGAIGQVTMVNSEFGFQAGEPWGNFRGDGRVGGGAIMDVGCYCISFSRLVAGCEPTSVHYACPINDRGYDPYGSGSLMFGNQMTASFGTGVHQNRVNQAWVYGKEGRIQLDSPWVPGPNATLTLYPREGEPQVFKLGKEGDNLYAMEADAVAQYLVEKECPHMSIADTLGNMAAIDALRASAGLHFELEAKS